MQIVFDNNRHNDSNLYLLDKSVRNFFHMGCIRWLFLAWSFFFHVSCIRWLFLAWSFIFHVGCICWLFLAWTFFFHVGCIRWLFLAWSFFFHVGCIRWWFLVCVLLVCLFVFIYQFISRVMWSEKKTTYFHISWII